MTATLIIVAVLMLIVALPWIAAALGLSLWAAGRLRDALSPRPARPDPANAS